MPLVCPIQRTIKVNNGHLLSPGMRMRVPWNNSRKERPWPPISKMKGVKE